MPEHLDVNTFIMQFQLDDEGAKIARDHWPELCSIHDDYRLLRPELQKAVSALTSECMSMEKVHSVRARSKDPLHLIEKIIRKWKDEPSRDISVENYRREITDLIGLRLLHIFKEDWEVIDSQVKTRWHLKGKVEANVRAGDSEISKYKARRCKINMSPTGYRSVHYIIKTRPGKVDMFAEVQVRTIFEEGWGEVDHFVRYPYERDEPTLLQFFAVFNRLAGSADEMGSFVLNLKERMTEWRNAEKSARAETQESLMHLAQAIADLNATAEQKEALSKEVERLRKVTPPPAEKDPLLEALSGRSHSYLTRSMTIGQRGMIDIMRPGEHALEFIKQQADNRAKLEELKAAASRPVIDAMKLAASRSGIENRKGTPEGGAGKKAE